MEELQQSCYYRVKSEFTREFDDGSLSKAKLEELVYGVNYTEVEELVHHLIETENRVQYGDCNYEIIKTKIGQLIYNDLLKNDDRIMGNDFITSYFSEGEDTGVGLYSVKVIFMTIDEKTAKEKRRTEVYYIPAESNADASERINRYLANSTDTYVIRDAKFDKTANIYWPISHLERLTQQTL